MAKKKKNYVLYAKYEGVKRYVVIDLTTGESSAVDSITQATLFPNKAVCEIVKRTLAPLVRETYPGLEFGYEEFM